MTTARPRGRAEVRSRAEAVAASYACAETDRFGHRDRSCGGPGAIGPARRFDTGSVGTPSRSRATASSPARTATTTTANIRPRRARDQGQHIDENCDGVAEPFPTLASGVPHDWSRQASAATDVHAQALQITQQFPKGWKATIKCSGKKCPFKSKTLKAAQGQEAGVERDLVADEEAARVPRRADDRGLGERAELQHEGRADHAQEGQAAGDRAVLRAAGRTKVAEDLHLSISEERRARLSASPSQPMLLPSRPSMVSVVVCLVLGLVLVAAAGLKAAGGPSARRRSPPTASVAAAAMRSRGAALIARRAAPGVRRRRRSTRRAWAAAPLRRLRRADRGARRRARRARRAPASARAGASGPRSTARTALLAAALALAPLLPRTRADHRGVAGDRARGRAARPRRAGGRRARARARGRRCCGSRSRRRARSRSPTRARRSARSSRSRTSSTPAAPGRIALAVFTSEGCGVCRALEPAIERFGRTRASAAHVRRGRATRDAWAAADVPGSPFAVALDTDGTVLAKGTFNTRRQLEIGARGGRAAAGGAGALKRTARWSTTLAAGSSRRGFLARVGAAVMGVTGARTVGALVAPGRGRGLSLLRAHLHDGLVPAPDRPAADRQQGLPDPRQERPAGRRPRPLHRRAGPPGRRRRRAADRRRRRAPARATRTPVCTARRRAHGFKHHVDGAWYRCCGGHVRKLVDCCGPRNRINGDKALTGYCYKGRKVFCVMYYDTKVPC